MLVAEYTIPGLHIRDHLCDVPLDWSRANDGRTISVFAREVVDPAKAGQALPKLVFLQGGPGGKSPRPMAGAPAWLDEALKTHTVILLDQRGTGRSTRIESATMAGFASGAEAADYLACFRADSIVSDLEYLRKTVFGGDRWESFGQSYGGFLTLTYLSMAPEGLSGCYIAGGLAGLATTADDVYRHTYPRIAAKTARYYQRYPHDRERIGRIADVIAGSEVRLPDGDQLSVRRLQTLGLDFGMGPGFERVHWLMDEAFSTPGEDRLSDHFLAAVAAATSFDENPLFAVLQESIYGQGVAATNWAAERIRAEFPDTASNRRPLQFTGEMMYPWMFEEIRSLRAFRSGAEALAARQDYAPLYDLDRLASNDIPVSAIIYHDDLYVDAGISITTAAAVGNLEHWITNEYEHDGIHQGPGVFQRLVEMTRRRGGPRL